MKLAIMQPYFLPYLGYFQLMHTVDKFVVYDNIKFTKKGWINRNRILQNGNDCYITLPIKKDSDYLNINQRFLADDFEIERLKFKRKIHGAYSKAPFYEEIIPLIDEILDIKEPNLFNYIYHTILTLNRFLKINVDLIKSSSLNINIEELKGQEKVLAICKTLKAETYINSIGGVALYDRLAFKKEGINLQFIKTIESKYNQFENVFIPYLSIIDVLMFNDIDEINKLLNNYELY